MPLRLPLLLRAVCPPPPPLDLSADVAVLASLASLPGILLETTAEEEEEEAACCGALPFPLPLTPEAELASGDDAATAEGLLRISDIRRKGGGVPCVAITDENEELDAALALASGRNGGAAEERAGPGCIPLPLGGVL